MNFSDSLHTTSVLAPSVLMAAACVLAHFSFSRVAILWKVFQGVATLALAVALLSIIWGPHTQLLNGWMSASVFSLVLATLVQGLGTVIGSFSSRYLEGESGQQHYIAMLAAVLACVHLLLLADHWVLLIGAWAGLGLALERLLCFYPERPFAHLAALKKRIADRLADLFLFGAAGLAWWEVGSGSLSALWLHIAQQGMSLPLHASAVLLVIAVVLRSALLPVHGWLIQVMEAPTPVSALLHAGVVNLGGFVLIRFAPLLEQAAIARGLLLILGLATAVLAGMVMLTRISIKVRLAWSTVAQMGFMLMECALGLYTLAALHLLGHSLYKAHAFLSASSVVRETRIQALHTASAPSGLSVILAPLLAIGIVTSLGWVSTQAAWPWWWSALLGLAWAPMLWLPRGQAGLQAKIDHMGQFITGAVLLAVLALAAYLAHLLPLGLEDAPYATGGPIALAGMAALYLGLALLQTRPLLLEHWRRWSYAGFYVDEAYTRWALQWWSAHWAPTRKEPRPSIAIAQADAAAH